MKLLLRRTLMPKDIIQQPANNKYSAFVQECACNYYFYGFIKIVIQFKNIILTHFRNYKTKKFAFTNNIIGICGPNGSGKTNLLDAVYYTCFTKSYFLKADSLSVHHGLQGMRIEALVTKDNEENTLVCILRENNRKEFLLNGGEYKKFSLHIGKFPCVMIAPDDIQLISGLSEERRNFIDAILSQIHAGYLQHLIAYNKILQQRNSLLKTAAEHHYTDEALLDILDDQLAEKGQQLYCKRNEFLIEFIPLVTAEYAAIAGNDDAITVDYDSQLSAINFKDLLKENRQRDLYMQRTGCGIHKDDVEIKMKGQPFKILASQGQRKSLLFALKLAEYAVLKKYKGFAPVLLLDDVFEKLDAQRMHKLLQKVCAEKDAQVFITDTHRERLQKAFEEVNVNYQLIEL